MEIYLIRHTSVDVPAGYAYGQTDVPLKPTFEEEAEEVKKGLSDHTFDKVWTSPLTRCVRLANYCGFPEAEREDRIKEVNFGEWEMKSWNELSSDPRSEAWFKDWDYSGLPGNILGQTCPQFALLFLPLSAIAIIIDDFVRWKWFDEEKPRYKWR